MAVKDKQNNNFWFHWSHTHTKPLFVVLSAGLFDVGQRDADGSTRARLEKSGPEFVKWLLFTCLWDNWIQFWILHFLDTFKCTTKRPNGFCNHSGSSANSYFDHFHKIQIGFTFLNPNNVEIIRTSSEHFLQNSRISASDLKGVFACKRLLNAHTEFQHFEETWEVDVKHAILFGQLVSLPRDSSEYSIELRSIEAWAPRSLVQGQLPTFLPKEELTGVSVRIAPLWNRFPTFFVYTPPPPPHHNVLDLAGREMAILTTCLLLPRHTCPRLLDFTAKGLLVNFGKNYAWIYRYKFSHQSNTCS